MALRAEGPKRVNCIPHADLASPNPVWRTADITWNYALGVFDPLSAHNAQCKVHPLVVKSHHVRGYGKAWELPLGDDLALHDGKKVLARDCVVTTVKDRTGEQDCLHSPAAMR